MENGISKREENRRELEKKFLIFFNELEEYELLEENFKYLNFEQRVQIKHKVCGMIFFPKISKFWGENSRCPNSDCFREKRTSHLRKSDKFLEVFEGGKYKLLEENFKYLNKRQRVKVQHIECGTIFNPIIDGLVRKQTICPRCKHKKRQKSTIENFYEIFKYEKDYELEKKDFLYDNTNQKIKIIHKKCNKIFEPTIHNFLHLGSRCPNCCNTNSKGQKEVLGFVESLGLETKNNIRTIISPYEIDIFVPEKNVGFEYNGLYWHSEEQKGKEYHFEKSRIAREKGIKLFHIFSDEWKQKQEIVKSMIRNALGLSSTKVNARECECEVVEKRDARIFFDRTHITGDTQSTIVFALKKDGKIVSALSLRKPIKKKYEKTIEIARFSNELNTIVNGGFGKLLSCANKWASKSDYQHIISYADLRFGKGNVYEKNGFKNEGTTDINYWYTDGETRFPRQKFRANLEEGKTEKMVAEENNVYKVYGSGHYIFKLDLKCDMKCLDNH
ncbi:MAG: hypothetical protein Q8P81_04365 [Nanoarchaeota archaeon]|nr:hypothetical protein [Nanoarchaeota archaeon]